MSMQTDAFVLEDVTITLPSVDGDPLMAVNDVSFRVKSSEFLTIVGPSGCGKSTLLNAMSGLIAPSHGKVLCGNDSPVECLPTIGYISQADTLLPWYSVLDNVALGLRFRGFSKKQRYAEARQFLHQMGLSNYETLYPHELSGGMKKRVSIARTLALKPSILLLDEPFAPLDAFTKETLQEDLLNLWDDMNLTIVYVTHDLSEAIFLSDRVLLMHGAPGNIKAEFPITLPRPRHYHSLKFTEDFITLETSIRSMLSQSEQTEKVGVVV